jgi:hypothetical protein
MKEEGKQKSGGSITGRDVATLVINCQAPSMAVRVRENVRERLLLLFPFCGIAENFTSNCTCTPALEVCEKHLQLFLTNCNVSRRRAVSAQCGRESEICRSQNPPPPQPTPGG